MPMIHSCGPTIHLLYSLLYTAFGSYKRDPIRYDPNKHIKLLGKQLEEELV